MAMKTFRPLTPVLRYKTVSDFGDLTGEEPFRPLMAIKRSTGGRNNYGRMTVRHRGGGHKRYLRKIDFLRDKKNVPGVVETIEYDPNRSCRIALIRYRDGERRYILATTNMKPGMAIMAADTCEISEGNTMPLKNVPPGIMVHNIEMREGKGGQVARTAGAYADIAAKENNMVQLRFPSGEIRSVRENCIATIGQVGNIEHMNVIFGSAGRKRHLGRRPRVRGIAMNPVDHPMGGGEGRSKSGGGRHHPVSPWGQKAKGLKTRRRKKASSRYIVKRRGK